MEIRIHSETAVGEISRFAVNDDFVKDFIQSILDIAMNEVDRIPMGKSSIKAIIGAGMRRYGVKNPNPQSMTDLDFACLLVKEKLSGYLVENGLDMVGDNIDT